MWLLHDLGSGWRRQRESASQLHRTHVSLTHSMYLSAINSLHFTSRAPQERILRALIYDANSLHVHSWRLTDLTVMFDYLSLQCLLLSLTDLTHSSLKLTHPLTHTLSHWTHPFSHTHTHPLTQPFINCLYHNLLQFYAEADRALNVQSDELLLTTFELYRIFQCFVPLANKVSKR